MSRPQLFTGIRLVVGSKAGRAVLAGSTIAALACGQPTGDPDRRAARPRPLPAIWADPSFRTGLPGGWALRSCSTDPYVLCVEAESQGAGSILLRDLPSLGEEKTTSAEQVQAVLAGRINSMYLYKAGRWGHECGKEYRVGTARPRTVGVGGHEGMKYELTGSRSGRVAERAVGYWTFREGIETVIEAAATTGSGCGAEPLAQLGRPPIDGLQVFTPQLLSRFEPVLDRVAAGSRLPPAASFTPRPDP